MFLEQRKHTRLSCEGRVGLKMRNGHLVLVNGALNDFSRGGFRLDAQDEIDTGEKVEFFIKTPSLGHSLRGTGKIKNTRPIKKFGVCGYSLGVEFTQVDKKKGWSSD